MKELHQSHQIEITNWQSSYSFSVGQGHLEQKPYSEYAHLQLFGTLLSGTKYQRQSIQGWVMGERELDIMLDGPDDNDQTSVSVGSINLRGERREFILSVPLSAHWGIIQLLAVGKTRILNLNGEKLRYGNARITSIHFQYDIDPDDIQTW